MIAHAMTGKREEIAQQNGRKFSLWLLIIGIVMLFAAFTSAMIVRMAQGNWLFFELPQEFLYSTIIVVASSLPMFIAYRAAKKDEINTVRISLLLTLLLGIAFTYMQYMAWMDLFNRDIVFSPTGEQTDKGLISGSYVILLAGVHLIHILGGIVFLLVVLTKAFTYKVHKKNLLSINMCNTYWHFVGFLWVYLYLFLYFAPQF